MTMRRAQFQSSLSLFVFLLRSLEQMRQGVLLFVQSRKT